MKQFTIELVCTEDEHSPTGVHIYASCVECRNNEKNPVDSDFIDSDMRIEGTTLMVNLDEHIALHMGN